MNEHDDGGPVYPSVDFTALEQAFEAAVTARDVGAQNARAVKIGMAQAAAAVTPGMALRDWFAGEVDGVDYQLDQTLATVLTGRPMPVNDPLAHLQWWAEALAAWRGMIADAMIAEKRRGGEG